MRRSQLFTKTFRELPKDEESINAQLLIRAGYVQKLMAGVYTFLPLGLLTLRNIENVVRDEMNRIGGQEVLMPALHPIEYIVFGLHKNQDYFLFDDNKILVRASIYNLPIPYLPLILPI